MHSYVVLGHGLEDFGADRAVVPPGCLLVLSERAGESGIIHWPLYESLSDPAHKSLFANPIKHKKALERLVHRHLRIYKEGQPYPALTYDISIEQEDSVDPTGVFRIPTPTFRFHEEKEGPGRYKVSMSRMNRAHAGSKFAMNKAISQETLFATRPGIYYSFLCRTLKTEEDTIKGLMGTAFPGIDADDFYGDSAFDFFEGAQEWVSHQEATTESQTAAIAEIKAIVGAVMHHRRASSARQSERRKVDPLTRLMNLLGMKRPPAASLATAIADADVNAVYYKTQYTPLGAAAAMGHRSAVAALLARGAAINGRDLWGATALYRAADDEKEEVSRDLLAAGADSRIPMISGDTVLHVVAESEDMIGFLPELLTAGVDLKAVNQDGDTPLHSAAVQGNAAAIPLLLAAGADPNAQNKKEQTPLILGILFNHLETVTALAAVTDPRLRTEEDLSALELAIEEGYDDVAVEIAKAQKYPGGWAAVKSAANGLPRLTALATRMASSSEKRKTRKKTSSA